MLSVRGVKENMILALGPRPIVQCTFCPQISYARCSDSELLAIFMLVMGYLLIGSRRSLACFPLLILLPLCLLICSLAHTFALELMGQWNCYVHFSYCFESPYDAPDTRLQAGVVDPRRDGWQNRNTEKRP